LGSQSKRLRVPAPFVLDVARERKRSRTSETGDFLATPMYRLVDRHRAILEKIRTREDAEYWGHMLIGEYYPDIPSSRAASGKLAALVGLTDYMDFYCASGYYELLKEGKTLEEARQVIGKRAARRIRELTRALASKKASASRRNPEDAAVLESASRKVRSAGLTRKKARELLDEVKTGRWNRRYGRKTARK